MPEGLIAYQIKNIGCFRKGRFTLFSQRERKNTSGYPKGKHDTDCTCRSLSANRTTQSIRQSHSGFFRRVLRAPWLTLWDKHIRTTVFEIVIFWCRMCHSIILRNTISNQHHILFIFSAAIIFTLRTPSARP